MGNTDKYKVYQLYKSSDGINWSPRDEYKAVLLEEKSTDCGYSARTITTSEDDCSGTTKVITTTVLNQESEDFGETWTTVSSSSTKTYEYDSEDCGYTPKDYSQDYFTLVARNNGTFKFSGSTSGSVINTISYSTDDGLTWSTPEQVVTVKVNSGDKVFWKGEMTPVFSIGRFSGGTAYFDVQGNIMSLLYGDNFENQTSLFRKHYVFSRLFKDSNVVDASNLVLPATTLADRCCWEMFANCTSLTTAPSILPATTLADLCYEAMFLGCTSLTTAPQLPATTLGYECYAAMFSGCTSLTTAPSILPATTLTNYCYAAMFYGCTSLTTTPQLPATTLAKCCYEAMFRDCTSLTTAPSILPATTLKYECYGGMFYGCTSLTTAPQLPATTLAERCYANMFKYCTNLKYIKMLATDISASQCLYFWVDGVVSSGTFVKNASMTSLPRGINGIPYGWTVQDA